MTSEAQSTVRLLLIDDDLRLADYLRILLRRTRTAFHVDPVDNAAEGLQILEQGLHDVCLLDYRLGADDGDGLDLLRRRAHRRKFGTPIVLLTGDDDTSLELTALEAGAADYLNKADLNPGRLERVICRTIARHRADAALHERETRLAEAEAFALVMPAHISLDGRWITVPGRFCDLLGYTEEQVLRRPLTDLMHPDDLPGWQDGCRRLGWGGARTVESERRYVHKDGETVWMYQNCSLVSVQDGTPSYMLTYLREIGAQKRAEEALRASEQRYRSIVRRAPYGIFEAASDGRFLAVNPALVRMLGVDSEQAALRLNPDELYGGAEGRRRVFERLSIPGSAGVDTAWTRPDGSSVLAQIGADFSPEADGVFTGIVEDVTERRRLEEQLRQAYKMEAVGQLAGGVAHDFNNLLTAILGYSELLKDRCSHMPEVRADIAEIHKAGETAAELTAQLLVFSRKSLVRPEILQVNSVIDGMHNLLTRVLGEDVTLVVTLGAEVPAIEADRVQIQQLILNLAVNARDAMPRGGRLTIETAGMGPGDPAPRAPLPPGRYATIVVRDEGCGMDRETQSHIFEPFFTTKPQGKGTGLGLSTVYGIIKRTGGDIVCESQPDAGTTFSIFLPATNKVPRPEVGVAPVAARGSETVLLVEDQAAVRRLTRRFLERHGYQVFDTADAGVALRVAAESPFDLLLTDVVMPHMSGPELARGIRAFAPDMPVLFMSGFSGHASLDDLSGSPLLSKPFTPEELVAKVRELLERRHPAGAPASHVAAAKGERT